MSRYRINRIIDKAAAVTPKDRVKMRTQTMRFFVVDWHENLRARHFTNEGARVYRYAKRKTKEVTTGQIKTTRRGRKLAPIGLPLVWSGTSFSLSKIGTFHAKEKTSWVTMPVRAFNFKPPGNPTLNMREEFTRVLGNELHAQEKQATVLLERLIRRFNGSRRQRITA